MTAAYERRKGIAASFARKYYTALLQKPEALPGFYTPDASFEHMGCKAQGSAEIETAVKRLYSAPSDATVNVASLLAVASGERGIRVTIQGTIPAAAGHAERSFTHEVQLLEHPTQPGCFGITADTRQETAVPDEPHPTRWACETPPMFAKPPAPEAMEPIEQPAATTAVAPVDPPSPPRSATPEAASKSNATESPIKGEAPAESQGESTSQEAPAEAPEPKKPRSFAEAAMMSRRAGAAPSTSVPVTVVAKESKEQPPAHHAAPARDAKGPLKGANGRKPTNAAEGERRAAPAAATSGERPNAPNTNSNHVGNGNSRNGREGAPKPRREGEARMLSPNVIFFDVIVKGLPANATEQTVRDIVEPTAPVKLIKLLSQKDKKDTSVLRTFAFVQLDHDAIKETDEEVQSMVAKLLEGSKGRRGATGQRIQIDKVREKYTAAPAPAPAAASTSTTAPTAATADVPAA